MNKTEVRNTLEQLRGEIDQLKFREPKSRERVQQLISAIERQLENSDDAAHERIVNQDLAGAIELFEVEHPRLTATLNQIATALSTMGI